MKVVRKGDGEPEFTVMGSVHGDEPAGKEAIERFLSEEREFHKPAQFVIGNEKALLEGQRFLESDLNRSFPGDPESERYEERLASKIIDTVEGTKLLDIHTTHSYPLPFATCSTLNDKTRDMLASTGVKNAAHFPGEEGKLHEHVEGVVVEAGFQGTDQAVENALGVIKNFLTLQGVIDGKARKSSPQLFEVIDKVEGDWSFGAENFKKVEEGEVYATRGDDSLRAEKPFYPVLMSTNGYNGTLGYRARRKET